MGKQEELLHYMELNNIQIAAIQESKLTSKSKMKPSPNYTVVRKDRGNDVKGGGLLFFVHHTVPFQKLDTPTSLKEDKHLEEITIQINSDDNPLKIRNVYIPPASSCSPGYEPPIQNLKDGLGDLSLILGDVNAHHQTWFSGDVADARGKKFMDWLGNTDRYGIVNEDTATRSTPTSDSAPDLTIASTSLLPTINWCTNTALSSDHLPIHLTISSHIQRITAQKKTFVNFKKAKWENFFNYTEEIFASAEPENDPHKGEKFFRKTIQKAANLFIPKGRIPTIINAVPTDTAKLIDERNQLRDTDPANPRIEALNRDINQSINKHRKEKWNEHLENCPPGSKRLWDTIKSLNNNGPKQSENQSIKFDNKHYEKPKKLATMFNKQFTPNTNTKPSKGIRNTLRNIRKVKDEKITFTVENTAEIIKKSKNSKAMGPDELSPVMLKHLGHHALTYLTNIFNNTVNKATIPPMWKIGRIIPLLKPNKPEDEGTSFRPISLLSPAIKILEGLILPIFQDAITLAPHQHSFRKKRSTLTALQSITDHIKTGLNQKKTCEQNDFSSCRLDKGFRYSKPRNTHKGHFCTKFK